jgi:hypothetical protein
MHRIHPRCYLNSAYATAECDLDKLTDGVDNDEDSVGDGVGSAQPTGEPVSAIDRLPRADNFDGDCDTGSTLVHTSAYSDDGEVNEYGNVLTTWKADDYYDLLVFADAKLKGTFSTTSFHRCSQNTGSVSGDLRYECDTRCDTLSSRCGGSASQAACESDSADGSSDGRYQCMWNSTWWDGSTTRCRPKMWTGCFGFEMIEDNSNKVCGSRAECEMLCSTGALGFDCRGFTYDHKTGSCKFFEVQEGVFECELDEAVEEHVSFVRYTPPRLCEAHVSGAPESSVNGVYEQYYAGDTRSWVQQGGLHHMKWKWNQEAVGEG